MGLLKELHDMTQLGKCDTVLPGDREERKATNFFLLYGRWPTEDEIRERSGSNDSE